MKPSRSSLLKAIGMPIAFFIYKKQFQTIVSIHIVFSQFFLYFSQRQYIILQSQNKNTKRNKEYIDINKNINIITNKQKLTLKTKHYGKKN